MRLFIAIEIPDEVIGCIAEIQEKIGFDSAKIRFVDKEQIHLTLKFLGEVQPKEAEQVKDLLKNIKFEPFSACLDSVGVFPGENYIRVVWVGLKPEDKVLELQKQIDEKLKGLFKKEKDFKAHVTLARVKYLEDKREFVEKLKKIRIEKKGFDVNNFKLIKSTLSSKGAVYDVLEEFAAK